MKNKEKAALVVTSGNTEEFFYKHNTVHISDRGVLVIRESNRIEKCFAPGKWDTVHYTYKGDKNV